MKVGYLHLGPEEHGILRYSKILESAAHSHPEIQTISARVSIKENKIVNEEELIHAAQILNGSDIIHIQHNQFLWGGSTQLSYLKLFKKNCRKPVIATLHDLHLTYEPFNGRNLIHYLKFNFGKTAKLYKNIFDICDKVFVCNQQEVNRLKSVTNGNSCRKNKLSVIPHYVENRATTYKIFYEKEAVKKRKSIILTLLGWIHPRKGHQLIIEILPQLPYNVELVFAGEVSPGSEQYLKEILALAQRLGVRDRITVTGYLSEKDLESCLFNIVRKLG
jgi:glycosyltransferase involved in cell wall biosynthesis